MAKDAIISGCQRADACTNMSRKDQRFPVDVPFRPGDGGSIALPLDRLDMRGTRLPVSLCTDGCTDEKVQNRTSCAFFLCDYESPESVSLALGR